MNTRISPNTYADSFVEIRDDGKDSYVVLKDGAVLGWIELKLTAPDGPWRATDVHGKITRKWSYTGAVAALTGHANNSCR